MFQRGVRITVGGVEVDVPMGVFSAGQFAQYDAATGKFIGAEARTVYQAADQSGVGTTLTAITNLVFNVTAGLTYYFEFFGLYLPSAAAANNGPKFDLNLAASAAQTTFDMQLDIQSTTGTYRTTAPATVVQTTSAPPAAIDLPWRCYGRMVCSGTGTIQLRVATVSAGTLTLRRGALGRLWT